MNNNKNKKDLLQYELQKQEYENLQKEIEAQNFQDKTFKENYR